MKKNFYYKDIDGEHFPDASVGDELYYSILFSCWLTNEGDTLEGVTWTVSDGLTVLDEAIQGGEVKAKIRCERAGSFRVLCTLDTIEDAQTQTKNVPMILKVY